MWKVGCVIALIGIVCIGGAVFMGVSAARGAMNANKVVSVPLSLGQEVKTDVLTVSTDKLCQVAVSAAISSSSVVEETIVDDKKLKMQYNFPVSYTITDEAGKQIHSEQTVFAWNKGVRTTSGENVTSDGGTGTIETGFEKIQIASPGKIIVTATVSPDAEFNAQAANPQLVVYDNVVKHGAKIAGTAIFFVVGGGCIGLGFLVFIIGLITGKKQPAAA